MALDGVKDTPWREQLSKYMDMLNKCAFELVIPLAKYPGPDSSPPCSNHTTGNHTNCLTLLGTQ